MYEACARGVRDTGRRARLTELAPHVAAAAVVYAQAAMAGGLHDLSALRNRTEKDPSVRPNKDDRAELVRLYSEGLVQNKAGRVVYDLLVSAAADACPFCGHFPADTLDHVLPKSEFALLSVTPDNLVPACTPCNHRKNNRTAAAADEQPLHPYFEHADTGRWLTARLLPGLPPVVQFFAEPDGSFSEVIANRIRHQFKQYALAELYTIQAQRLIAGERGLRADLRSAGGSQLLAKHLRASAQSWVSTSVNCWQRAAYEAMAADRTFVDEL
ncbi:HNH endonuclease [Actinoplanes teichomyceticus]|uniref:HNH endonuclease n=1 Tax=Actinoplanes teichomyceticus TaxID=1867 RepID=A0A561VGI3_ACTTI|nr:HNH endonuclease [Actinoplanes teichomyceticus]